MDEVLKIINDLQAGIIKPIYLLMGEEPYYIDKITEYLEKHLLTDEEKEFNQMILYGRDTSIDEIVSNAKRFPLMADRQVIIIKEAQDLHRTIDSLEKYLEKGINIKSNWAVQWPGGHPRSSQVVYEETIGEKPKKCSLLDETLTIRSNGDVVVCCYDLTSLKVMGNL